MLGNVVCTALPFLIGGSLGCYFDSLGFFVVSEINVNGYYIVGYRVCVALVTAKNTKLLYCVRVRARVSCIS